MNFAWFYVILAGMSDIIWPFAMKLSEKYSATWGPLMVSLALSIPVSLTMGAALRHLPAGTVYACVVGIGAIGASLVGILFFGEGTQTVRILSLLLVIAGLIGLKLTAPSAQ